MVENRFLSTETGAVSYTPVTVGRIRQAGQLAEPEFQRVSRYLWLNED